MKPWHKWPPLEKKKEAALQSCVRAADGPRHPGQLCSCMLLDSVLDLLCRCHPPASALCQGLRDHPFTVLFAEGPLVSSGHVVLDGTDLDMEELHVTNQFPTQVVRKAPKPGLVPFFSWAQRLSGAPATLPYHEQARIM